MHRKNGRPLIQFLAFLLVFAVPAAVSPAYGKGINTQLQYDSNENKANGRTTTDNSLNGNFNMELADMLGMRGQDIGLNIRTSLQNNESGQSNRTFGIFRMGWSGPNYSVGSQLSETDRDRWDAVKQEVITNLEKSFVMNLSLRPEADFIPSVSLSYQKNEKFSRAGEFDQGAEGIQLATRYQFGPAEFTYTHTGSTSLIAGGVKGPVEKESTADFTKFAYTGWIGQRVSITSSFAVDSAENKQKSKTERSSSQNIQASLTYKFSESLSATTSGSFRKDTSPNAAGLSDFTTYDLSVMKVFFPLMRTMGTYQIQKPNNPANPKTQTAAINASITPMPDTDISMNMGQTQSETAFEATKATHFSYNIRKQLSGGMDYASTYSQSTNFGGPDGKVKSVTRTHRIQTSLVDEANIQAYASLNYTKSRSIKGSISSNPLYQTTFSMDWRVDNKTRIAYSSTLNSGSGKTSSLNFGNTVTLTKTLYPKSSINLRFSDNTNEDQEEGAAQTIERTGNQWTASYSTRLSQDTNLRFSYRSNVNQDPAMGFTKSVNYSVSYSTEM